MQIFSKSIYETKGVFRQPLAINFFHASLATSILSSSLVVKTRGFFTKYAKNFQSPLIIFMFYQLVPWLILY